MRKLFLLVAVVLVSGCAAKANIHKISGAAKPKPAHSRDVCLMDAAMPEEIEAVFMGRGVSNSQWYGGYAGVKALLAERSRQLGVDVVSDMQYRHVMGFFAWARPRVYGNAYALKNPAAFDCVAMGGEVYAPGAQLPTPASQVVRPVAAPVTTPAPAETALPTLAPTPASAPTPAAQSSSGQSYDDCMARVLRIQDEALRLQSMSMCDSLGQ